MNKKILAINAKYNLGNMQVFSYGNRKLPAETLIVNITSAQNCPSDKLGLCEISNVCYAKKCERIYKNYLAKNLTIERWMQLWSDEQLKEILTVYIQNAPHTIKYIRLNEAGDFLDQESVNRWSNIAEWAFNTFNIKTYCYTCREDLDFSDVKFSVNGSKPSINSDRHFICLNVNDFRNLPKGTVVCKADCKICKLCYDSNYKGVIYCKQH